jgi:hypothetical protein
MKTITNDELGVAIDYDNAGYKIYSARPRYESMLSNNQIEQWVEETLSKIETEMSTV